MSNRLSRELTARFGENYAVITECRRRGKHHHAAEFSPDPLAARQRLYDRIRNNAVDGKVGIIFRSYDHETGRSFEHHRNFPAVPAFAIELGLLKDEEWSDHHLSALITGPLLEASRVRRVGPFD